jgi:hypothetical protein
MKRPSRFYSGFFVIGGKIFDKTVAKSVGMHVCTGAEDTSLVIIILNAKV